MLSGASHSFVEDSGGKSSLFGFHFDSLRCLRVGRSFVLLNVHFEEGHGPGWIGAHLHFYFVEVVWREELRSEP